MIQAADGDFYGLLGTPVSSAGTPFYKVSPSGQYTVIAFEDQSNPYVFGNIVQGSDGNFYGSSARLGRDGSTTSFGPALERARLALADDGNFYGLTFPDINTNGDNGGGILYRFNTSGNYQALYSMDPATQGDIWSGAGLIQALDGNLYGYATYGGNNYHAGYEDEGPTGDGTVFRITRQGQFEVLHAFKGLSDGQNPMNLTAASDGNLYGNTTSGGDFTSCSGAGCGTVFRIGLDGSFVIVHTIEEYDGTPAGPYTAMPGGELYGPPLYEYESQDALVEMNTSGELATLYVPPSGYSTIGSGWYTPFTQGNDGNLYSIAAAGGTYGYGTVFLLSFTPALPAPVQIHLSSTAVSPGTPVTASFTVNNAFSLSMQQCYGFQIVNGTPVPLGKVSGKYDSGTQLYTGSVSFNAGSAGGYNYALTCGGVESGYAQLTVGTATTTALTANPDPVLRPASCTLTATVTASGGIPTGSVTFSTEGVTLGSAPLNGSGVATLTASSNGVTPATYPVIATYSGSQQNLPSSSAAVNVTVK